MSDPKLGDVFTIEGVYGTEKVPIPNPDRKPWQFWKPKTVMGYELKVFRWIY